jgi:hypothetical protein
MVALAAKSLRGEVRWLSGRYWDVQEDLEEILKRRQEVEEKDLYQLRIRKL